LHKKISTPEFENKVMEALNDAENPVTVQFIAEHCGIGWGTARAILLDLTLQGRVKMQPTTSTTIFTIEKGSEKS